MNDILGVGLPRSGTVMLATCLSVVRPTWHECRPIGEDEEVPDWKTRETRRDFRMAQVNNYAMTWLKNMPTQVAAPLTGSERLSVFRHR